MLELLAYLEKRKWLWQLVYMQVKPTNNPMYYAEVDNCSCRCGHDDPYAALLCAVAHAITRQNRLTSGETDEYNTLNLPITTEHSATIHQFHKPDKG